MKNKRRNIKLTIINLVCIIVILLSSISIYHKKSNHITESDYEQIHQLASMTNNNEEIEGIEEESKVISYKYAIETEGNIDEELISYLDTKLQLLPQSLLEGYFNNDGKILITDKNISKTYYKEYNFGNIIGLHDARKNIIYMSNSKYAVDNALIHEFGHVLDSLCKWDSMNNEFTEIYNTEKDTFKVKSVDGHYKTNQREFFAEVFQEYILRSDICKSSAPRASEFIKNKIESLNQ